MAIIKLSGEYIKQGFTQVDNVFLSDYLAAASGDEVKTYLAGLMLAGSGEEGEFLTRISAMTGLSDVRVGECFAYWEKLGLVEVKNGNVFFLSVKSPLPPVVRFNAQKFKSFTEETVRIFPDKILTPNEYNRYFEFITASGMDINAMLLIMQYCKDLGGGKTSTDYVLAVASAWAKDGLLKEKQIIGRIEELETYSEALRMLFEALGIKRAPTFEDRQVFASWQNNYGYSLDAILTAARVLKKRGGMDRLNDFVKELFAAQAVTAAEIAEYVANKQKTHDLCVKICKNVGVYYGNTESAEEVYVTPWLRLGFEPAALERISKYCFLRNARDLESVNQMVLKFAKRGLFTESDIAAYVDRQIRLDEKIRAVYEKCGFVGPIRDKDRENYRAWEEWGFDPESIFVVAEHFSDKTFPMSGINRMLGDLKNKGIFAEDAIRKYLSENNGRTQKAKGTETYEKHEYTEEELKKAFFNFDNWD